MVQREVATLHGVDAIQGAQGFSGTPRSGEVALPSLFPTTRWSVVLAAGRDDREALDTLCRIYWHPLYIYVRRRGYSEADAKDLTQEFFARVLKRNWIAEADRSRGRFRSFLHVSVNRFLSDEWNKVRAQKRGGHLGFLQFDEAETHLAEELADHRTPEQTYERRWVLTLLGRVLAQLSREYVAQGKAVLFTHLRPCLMGERDGQPCAAIASQMGMTEGSVRVAVYRMRQRYRQLVRDEIAATVVSPEEIEDELAYLFKVLARR